MTLIEWQDSFSVGVESVDHEHRELIDLINTVHRDAVAGCDPQDVVTALGEIYAQIAAHFALEERFMRESRYAAFVEHKADHEVLLDQLRDIMDRVETDGRYDADGLSAELGRWFTDHFRTHGALCGVCARQSRCRCSFASCVRKCSLNQRRRSCRLFSGSSTLSIIMMNRNRTMMAPA